MAETQTLTYLIRLKVDGTETAKLKQIQTAVHGLGGTMAKTATSSKSLSSIIMGLGSRALLTIPIWQGLRQVWLSLIGSINETVESLISLDEALINTKNELVGVSNVNVEDTLGKLREEAIKLAQETGTSATKIVETFRQFATAGMTVEESFAGMDIAVKGAVATMGDAKELGKLLADVYNQYGDRITEVSGTQNKFNYIMSTMSALMPTNVFTIDEFSESLKNFLGTAKAANLTLDQTFTLVAAGSTFMQRGSRGGTQLASAFEQLGVKTEKVRNFLGKDFQQGMSRFDMFMAILKKASSFAGTNNVIPQDIAEIFGLRGGRIVKADIAGFSKLVEELDRLNKMTPNERMAYLMERYGNALDKIRVQIARFTEVRNELLRTFIEGTTNGVNFAEVLKNINTALMNSKSIVETYSFAIGNLVQGIITLVKWLDKAKNLIPGMSFLTDTNRAAIFPWEGMRAGKEAGEREKIRQEIRSQKELQQANLNRLMANRALAVRVGNGKASKEEIQLYNASRSPQLEPTVQTAINQSLINDAKERYKLQGALNSEILKAEINIRKQLDLEGKIEDKIQRKIDLERALSEEKRMQNRIGNESLKLYEIAQTEGIDVARQIGELLAGQTDIGTFIQRGGRPAEVFQKQFADLYKDKQAEMFFKGDFLKGFQEMQGGLGIPIQEEMIRRRGIPSYDVGVSLRKDRYTREAISATRGGEAANQINTINNVYNINTQTPKEVAQEIETRMAYSIRTPGQPLNNAFKESLGVNTTVKR